MFTLSKFWPPDASAPPSFDFLIDEVGVAAYAAYSYNRKLREAYAGNAFRIRRSNDDAETNIGFSDNEVDTAAITTFVGANDAFVVTRYDQSENGFNLTQATSANQLQIVSSGTIITGPNGKIVARGDGTSDTMTNTGVTINPGTARLVGFNVLSLVSFTSLDHLWNAKYTDGEETFYYAAQEISSTGNKLRVIDVGSGTASGVVSTATFYLIRSQWDSTAKIIQINNDAEVSTADSLTGQDHTTLAMPGSGSGVSPANSEDAEFVIWQSNSFDGTATTTAKANINAYYAIY